MVDRTITSANSVFSLVVPSLFPAPVQLSGYATDDAFMSDALDLAETMMGVDGRLSAGYTPNPTKMTINLQADSTSRDFFGVLISAMKTAREVFFMSGAISLPATGESYALTRGVLSNVKQMPDNKKVLQPTSFVITWESVTQSLL